MTKEPGRSIVVTNQPTREQLDAIFDILDQCFSAGRAFFQERLELDSTYHPDTTWFATVDGQVAANVQIFPLAIRVGKAVLHTGAIGSVAADPNYRGMGLTHRILDAQTQYMKEAQYDLSFLLASKHAFYEKAGWRLIPQTAYAIQPPPPREQTENYEIIPFEPRYLEEISSLYEQFNENRTYSVVRSESYWKDLIRWPEWKKGDCLLLKKEDRIAAYGIIEKKDSEQVFMNEFIYLDEAGDGVEHLFHALCQLRPNAKQILAMLPDDHKLHSYFHQHQAQPVPIHLTMWKMLRLYSTFHKLQAELEERLNRDDFMAGQEMLIALQCGEDTIFLDYRQQRLVISEEISSFPDVSIKMDERSLITYLLFGYEAKSREEGAPEPHAGQTHILQALFPKQNAVFYLTDKF
ncbi:GCN5-like N-acetyltransferase [Paenibacillus algicola]|uniref:GCN5-like N-acetyltransferase n=1 Tax=Paenibacillus algicola TaxID=2565926 RepID=A0A4P8XFT6_9BACL|nr:GNAT family N-acetyltransferase [Paenibacillus algicola]QCT00953.1 GCN5-like N-acetyltransferase [Paenibacillus algicola]